MAVRLSVVVPVYGTEKYLRACLDSLATQTLRDAEFLLVDDASPDHSARIMAEYAARDPRFRILRHDANRGLFAARVTGAKAAQGEYLAFLDSDDYVSVDFYRAAADKADEGFDVVMGDTVWVEDDGTCVVRPVHREIIPMGPLCGRDVRDAFYGQEMSCYSWHTIWNKVYRKALFDRCLPWFERLPDHIIMTEDIAFSSILLYEASSFVRIEGDGVFYCMHKASSTNAAYADEKRFFKNYGDIVKVFEFVSRFLHEKQDEDAQQHLMNARIWYCRMWSEARRQCAKTGEARTRADALTDRLAPGFDPAASPDDAEIWWFDRQTVPWNSGLEKIKRAIAGLDGHDQPIISFDVFDTLIQRPFRQPDDLFYMMEDKWRRANRRCMLSFASARSSAETSARVWARDRGKEDIDLYDIYNALRVTCGASEDCADTMRFVEQETEIEYVQPRRTGVALFRLAKALGKRVVLISDMYLDKETITAMLNKCGVDGWDAFFLSNEENALKWNGGLYQKALAALDVPPGKVLHIGDNWNNDYLKPDEMGIAALHHPRAMDVMTDRDRTALGTLGLQTASSFGGDRSLQSVLSFRCMQALAADRFFDNGFAPTQRASFFAGSPALMGYFPLGGHVLAVAQWLLKRCKADGVTRLIFLARDGWLIKQAMERILPEDSGLVLDYQPASRRCLLPALTANPSDFYALPINTPAYSVGKLVHLLDFCTADRPEKDLRREAEDAGFDWEAPFPGRYKYLEFIRWYLDNQYDGCKHQRAYNTLRDYYEPLLTEGTACFDMGYSGRLQAALSQLACRGVPVYFIHDDEQEAPRLSQAYEFPVECFYGMKPGMSGAFREFLLSSDEPPCIGFTRTAEGVRPVYGRSEYNAAARAFIRIAQENALRFVSDYTERFRGTLAEQVKPIPASMPFESMLRYLPEGDIGLFSGIRFEDTVFAGRDDLDLAALIRDQSDAANADAKQGMVGFIPYQTPLLKRVIGFLLFDRETFKRKLKGRLHPRLWKLGKCCWHQVKRVRTLMQRGAR